MKLVQFQYNPKDFTPTTLLEKATSGHTGMRVIAYESGRIAGSELWFAKVSLEPMPPVRSYEDLVIMNRNQAIQFEIFQKENNELKELYTKARAELHNATNYGLRLKEMLDNLQRNFDRTATAARESWNKLTAIKSTVAGNEWDWNTIEKIKNIINQSADKIV